ncbi:Ig-like domain-containing protein [Flavonifractor sp. HCP28S3_F3]|uniref:Ig-like domain-containing protein n=1 Tax=Flavonifractor sp. HCP28S3_F3 TaxID=3438939 RepID=UPI003F8BE9E3
MRQSRRFLAAALATAILLTVPVFAASTDGFKNFQPVNTYTSGTFRDVPASSWYAESVGAAYELGLMQGTGKGEFEPGMTITLAETVALAARIHSIYHTGAAEFAQGSPWYQVYLDYAGENSIFTAEAATSPKAYAHRDQFAAILASALPAQALEPINTVDDGMIPDVPEGAANYDDIYLLYRAGVLTGSDGKGTFHPDTAIDRASVAALVTRLVQPDLRQAITLERQEGDERVSLDQDSLTLTVGDSARLTATAEPKETALTWTSSNPTVATVDGSGTVTALAAGTATIMVRTETASAACLVRVENELIPATGVGISIRQLDLDTGESFRLTAAPIPGNASNNSVYWEITFPSGGVQAVSLQMNEDQSCTVTGLEPGTATVRAVIAGAGTESCTVTIHDPAEDRPSAGLPFSKPFQAYGNSACPQVDGAWVVCLEDEAQNALCVDNPSQPHIPFIPYYYAWYFDAGMDGPVGADVNYSASRPDVLKVDRDFTEDRSAAFVVTALSPGRCTVTAEADGGIVTMDFLVPDTSLTVAEASMDRQFGGYLSDTITAGGVTLRSQFTFALTDYADDFATYTVTLTTDGQVQAPVQLARLTLQTEDTTQEVGILTVDTAHDGDGAVHTFQVQVPRGMSGTLCLTKG